MVWKFWNSFRLNLRIFCQNRSGCFCIRNSYLQFGKCPEHWAALDITKPFQVSICESRAYKIISFFQESNSWDTDMRWSEYSLTFTCATIHLASEMSAALSKLGGVSASDLQLLKMLVLKMLKMTARSGPRSDTLWRCRVSLRLAYFCFDKCDVSWPLQLVRAGAGWGRRQCLISDHAGSIKTGVPAVTLYLASPSTGWPWLALLATPEVGDTHSRN